MRIFVDGIPSKNFLNFSRHQANQANQVIDYETL